MPDPFVAMFRSAMVANETLHGIIDACDPRDRKDVKIRKGFVAALENVLARCTPDEDAAAAAAAAPAEGSGSSPGFCLLKRGRRITHVCNDCLLSEIPVGAGTGDDAADAQDYEFTAAELSTLGRWYSAVRHVFPGAKASLCANHEGGYSHLRLYEGSWGSTPTTVIFKHRLSGKLIFSCITAAGEMHGPFASLTEITDPQVQATEVPEDETIWLDPASWRQVVLARSVVHRRL